MPAARPGIGSTLQAARESLGKSIEQVSRDTNIGADFLRALEREAFGALRGDVYVRSFLRSYATYLGLDADELVAAYGRRSAAAPEQPLPVAPEPIPQGGLGASRQRVTWPLVGGIALVLALSIGTIALLSGSDPPPAARAPVSPVVSDEIEVAPFVSVELLAPRPIPAKVISDGTVVFRGVLRRKERESFTAGSLLRLWIERGGVVRVCVNGHDLEVPGRAEGPYEASFTPQDYPEPSSECRPG